MKSATLILPVVLLGLAVTAPAAAQDPTAGPRLPPAWASSEPELAAPQGRMAQAADSRDLHLATVAVRRRAPGSVLMIVGCAVAVAGLLTDESLLVVGGVVVGAYGLFLYLG